ncbi:uncharacterized protein LOC113280751 [Papaver somniferum]|uniref:uncharacterized protein LOC113280751 n=1 Tax=Papaver somniferum TaxID=3469 RepID=UPI000E6FC05B|nr:uncharacterized protein LOC113280751 [Papaver somniferum]
MAKEIIALEANNAWILVDLPPGKTAIGCTWVFKIKFNADGTVESYKARLVAKGYTQQEGDLDEEIYMKLPPGMARPVFLSEGFVKSLCDNSIFTYHRGTTSIFVLVYVDDIIITGTNNNFINSLKLRLASYFSIKDLGSLNYFLGIEVSRSSNSIFLCQRKYILDILKDSGLTGARASAYPMDTKLKLLPTNGTELTDPSCFRCLIGRLLYLTVTRPDITYSVNYLSQFLQHPRSAHMDAAHRILRYLKGTVGHGIFLSSSSSPSIHGYTDSDWEGCPITRRSTTGYFVTLGNSPISWKSKKQPTVARSSAEAEYRALANLTAELQWLVYLFKDMHISCPLPITVSYDIQAAIHIAQNSVFHERTKHIEIDCYFVREKLISGLILPKHLPSYDQLADVFTKPLGAPQFGHLVGKLGVCSGSTAPT